MWEPLHQLACTCTCLTPLCPFWSLHADSDQPFAALLVLQYREDEPAAVPTNIMFDRRVVRGNTYAAHILPAEPVLHLSSKPQGTAAAA